jgi:hypothetical protein
MSGRPSWFKSQNVRAMTCSIVVGAVSVLLYGSQMPRPYRGSDR